MDEQHLRRSVSALFPAPRGPRTTWVGVEQELISRDLRDGSVVTIDRIRRSAGHSPYRDFLGFEPGGQVELSFPCARTVRALERRYRCDLDALRRDCAAIGVAVEALPVDPSRQVNDVPLQLNRPRYLGMQRHFDRIGPAGRQMMRLTASTQLCLDWWPGSDGLEQWRLAQLAGPALAATFAAGSGSRLAIWLAVDPDRTAFDGRLAGSDPVRAYAEFAAAAGTFAMPGDTAATPESAPFWIWWQHRDNRSQAAVDHHLSTLFPPVRPRGHYLEIRYLDAQPHDDVAIASAVFATLLYDDATRHAALGLLDGGGPALADDWRTAAYDPTDATLTDRGRQLLALAVAGMSRAEHGYLPDDIIGRTEAFIDSLADRTRPESTLEVGAR